MIILNNALDITADVEPTTTDEAVSSDIFGILAKKRDYVLRDPQGTYSPFSPRGYLYKYPWRGMDIEETGRNGEAVFKGQIYDVETENTGQGFTVKLLCRDPLSIKMEWFVDFCDVDTFTNWKSNALASAGATTIVLTAVTGSPNDPPVGAQISFTSNYSPSYLITAFDTGTNTATLDRQLVVDVQANDLATIAVPILQTPAQALKRAFVAVGLTDKIGLSFDEIHTRDALANRYLRIFIAPQNRVQFSRLLENLFALGDLNPSVSNFGVIDVKRGLYWNGTNILKSITGAELLPPIRGPYYDTTRLVYGYDLPYCVPATVISVDGLDVPLTGEVRLSSNQITAQQLEDFAATKIWKPVAVGSESMSDYEILYLNETIATYFGNRRLAYYGVGRGRIECGLKQSISGEPDKLYSISLFSDFLLNVRSARDQDLQDVPCTVMGYKYNREAQKFDSVVLEFTGIEAEESGSAAIDSRLLDESDFNILQEDDSFILID